MANFDPVSVFNSEHRRTIVEAAKVWGVRAYSRNWRLMYVEYQILMIPMQNSA
jgi:hypothetical protein